MIDLEKWPEPGLVIEFKTSEDADKMLKYLNTLFARLDSIDGELEGMWEHIRNLEVKLLSSQEYLLKK